MEAQPTFWKFSFMIGGFVSMIGDDGFEEGFVIHSVIYRSVQRRVFSETL